MRLSRHLPFGLALLLLSPLYVYELNRPRADFVGNFYDEGIRLAQLDLMQHGFRPFRDIFSSQGPLLLDYFYFFYAAFGRDAGAARLGAVVGALLGLIGVYLAGLRLWGRQAGLLALLLLGSSALLPQVSRLALAEPPSGGLAALAVGLALTYRQNGRSLWIGSALACLLLSLLIKPMGATALLPLGLAVAPRLRRSDRRLRMTLAAATVASGLAALWYVGADTLLRDVFEFRRGAVGLGPTADETWTPAANMAFVRRVLGPDMPLLALALTACWPLARTKYRWSLLLCGIWWVATVLVLTLYSPLSWKHSSYLLPPTALLAAGGLFASWRLLQSSRGWASRIVAGPSVLALVWLTALLPGRLQLDLTQLAAPEPLVTPRGDADDLVELLSTLSTPDDYVVTDHPYLAYAADRLVPPRLVDLSRARIRSGSIRPTEAIAVTERLAPAAIVFWAGRLYELRDYLAWVRDHYQLARLYGSNRAIYLRRDLAAPERGRPGQVVWNSPALLADSISVVGAAVEPGFSPHSLRLRSTWSLANRSAAGVLVTLDARDARRQAHRLAELPLFSSLYRDSVSPDTRFDLWRTVSLESLPAGHYDIELGLQDPDRAASAAALQAPVLVGQWDQP